MYETITRPTVMDRIRARADRRSKKVDDQGLALLDVLLGMAIFALIVIIAIQAIGQFRQRAYQTAVNSDAQQISVGVESSITDNQTVPAALDASFLSSNGINLTKNVSIRNYASNQAAGSYTFCTVHTTGSGAGAAVDAWALYESAKGSISYSGRGAPTGTGTTEAALKTGSACVVA